MTRKPSFYLIQLRIGLSDYLPDIKFTLYKRLKKQLFGLCDLRMLRRGAGAVERGGLENRCPGDGTLGSNPSLSDIISSNKLSP